MKINDEKITSWSWRWRLRILCRKTPKGNKYYECERTWNGVKTEEVDKAYMRNIVESDLDQYGYIMEHSDIAPVRQEASNDYKRVCKLAPELLPETFPLAESEDPVAMKINNPSHYCPPGYEYVEAYQKRNREVIKGYCRRKHNV